VWLSTTAEDMKIDSKCRVAADKDSDRRKRIRLHFTVTFLSQ